jgi:hypothetical protein
MKKLAALLLVSIFVLAHQSQAQVIDDDNGKTYYYYDTLTHKKVKEIFHHKQVIRIIPDKNNYGSYRDTMSYVKSGPYTRYFENGKLECSGYYNNERRDSIWKFYDTQGALLRTEKYRHGKLSN